MLATSITVLIDQCAHLSTIPFSWAHLTGGVAGLSAGFPLALYMFIGWENGPALAEECRDPRRSIPKALYISIAIATGLFVLFAYATVTGFHYKVTSIGRSSVPFLVVADHYLGDAAPLAWGAGVISVLATLIAAANSQARMLFDGGRSGLLPAALGRVRPAEETPVNALLTMAAAGLTIIAVWWAVHVVGLDHGSTNPVGLYAECSTMGTIVILFVYLLSAVALPVFMWRQRRTSFSATRHLVIPFLGAAALIVPFIELCKPGQPAPYRYFPYLALGLAAASAVAAHVVVRRHPATGSSEGTTSPER